MIINIVFRTTSLYLLLHDNVDINVKLQIEYKMCDLYSMASFNWLISDEIESRHKRKENKYVDYGTSA